MVGAGFFREISTAGWLLMAVFFLVKIKIENV
jgi:hypothetical protein